MCRSIESVTGFGISNKETLEQASRYSAGSIIGSAFVKAVDGSEDLAVDIVGFVKKLS